MFKKYPKKLLKALLYVLFIAALWVPLSAILITAIAVVTKNQILQSLLLAIIPLVIVTVFTYKRRLNFQDMRREYLEWLEERNLGFKGRTLYILKSPDFVCEFFAFLTIFLPLMVVSLIFSIQNIVTVLLSLVIFAICDLFAWYFVYRKWESERIRKYR